MQRETVTIRAEKRQAKKQRSLTEHYYSRGKPIVGGRIQTETRAKNNRPYKTRGGEKGGEKKQVWTGPVGKKPATTLHSRQREWGGGGGTSVSSRRKKKHGKSSGRNNGGRLPPKQNKEKPQTSSEKTIPSF